MSALSGERAARVATLDGKRLGLLSTGKTNCDALLERIGDLLRDRFDISQRRFWRKPSVYRFSPLKRMKEIREMVDPLLAGGTASAGLSAN